MSRQPTTILYSFDNLFFLLVVIATVVAGTYALSNTTPIRSQILEAPVVAERQTDRQTEPTPIALSTGQSTPTAPARQL